MHESAPALVRPGALQLRIASSTSRLRRGFSHLAPYYASTSPAVRLRRGGELEQNNMYKFTAESRKICQGLRPPFLRGGDGLREAPDAAVAGAHRFGGRRPERC